MAGSIGAVLILSSALVILCSCTIIPDQLKFMVVKAVKNLADYITPLKPTQIQRGKVQGSGKFIYEAGNRIPGDRLLAEGSNTVYFSSPNGGTVSTQYPVLPSDPNEGSVIDRYELIVTHAGSKGDVFISHGSIGQRRIQFIIQMRGVRFCTIQVRIYGYDVQG